MSGESKKPGWRCSYCGSTEIHHDATAQWNPETEDFEIVAVYDNHWCADCDNNPDISSSGTPVWGVPEDV